MFKAEPVDQYGNLIDRHNLWEMVGRALSARALPGFSDQEQFTFVCPGTIVPGSTAAMQRSRRDSTSVLDRADTLRAPGGQVTELHVTARLMYRKIDQFLLNFLFGKESGLTSPVTVMSEDRRTIKVTTLRSRDVVMQLTRRRRLAVDHERWRRGVPARGVARRDAMDARRAELPPR